MSSETDGTAPEPRRGADREPVFECREDSPATADEGRVLREILYGLPLRAGFTEEVLDRIIESEQSPIPGTAKMP